MGCLLEVGFHQRVEDVKLWEDLYIGNGPDVWWRFTFDGRKFVAEAWEWSPVLRAALGFVTANRESAPNGIYSSDW